MRRDRGGGAALCSSTLQLWKGPRRGANLRQAESYWSACARPGLGADVEAQPILGVHLQLGVSEQFEY